MICEHPLCTGIHTTSYARASLCPRARGLYAAARRARRAQIMPSGRTRHAVELLDYHWSHREARNAARRLRKLKVKYDGELPAGNTPNYNYDINITTTT